MFIFTPALSAMVGLALYTKIVTKECSKIPRELFCFSDSARGRLS